MQPFPQPVVPGDKGALCRLLRTPNEFLREELLQRRIKFCLWVSFPIGRHKKSLVVLLTGVAAKQILSVVEQEMPLSLTGKLGLQTLVNQFKKIRIIESLSRINLQGRNEKQHEQQCDDVQAAGRKGTGLRL